jgi:hypothetical protein
MAAPFLVLGAVGFWLVQVRVKKNGIFAIK